MPSKEKNSQHDSRIRQIIATGQDAVVNYANKVLKRSTNPVVASKSYRYLARQVALDLAEIESGKSIVFSSVTDINTNSEILLMFSHFLQDELTSRVLIIDATFKTSGLTRLLNLKECPGIIDVLSNEGDNRSIDSVIHPLKENIAFIAAGNVTKQKLPYISIKQIKPLIDKLKQEYEYVIIQQDNIRLDTRYLPFAKSADLVLLHIEERNTPISSFDSAKELFFDHQITKVKYILSEP